MGTAARKCPWNWPRVKRREKGIRKSFEHGSRDGRTAASHAADQPAEEPVAVADDGFRFACPAEQGRGLCPELHAAGGGGRAERFHCRRGDAIAGVTEHTHLLPIVEQIETDQGRRPEQMLVDGHYATGQNIDAFENSGTDLISPLPVVDGMSANPALRADPTQAVPETEWPNLLRGIRITRSSTSLVSYTTRNRTCTTALKASRCPT